MVAENQFITGEVRTKVVANKSWFKESKEDDLIINDVADEKSNNSDNYEMFFGFTNLDSCGCYKSEMKKTSLHTLYPGTWGLGLSRSESWSEYHLHT